MDQQYALTQSAYRHRPIIYRIAVSVFFFACGCTFASWASRIPSVKQIFHLNEAQLGSVLFLLPMGSVAVLPVAGWAISKFGSRGITMITGLAYASTLLSIAFCATVGQLSVALFFFGFFGNALNISMNTQALHVQDHLYKKPLMSSFHALWSAGAMTGALTGGWMMQADNSLIKHFVLVAGFLLLLYLIMFFYLVKADDRQPKQKFFVWPTKRIWLLGIICFCCTLGEGAMADWSSLYYMQVINELNKVSTVGYTAFAFTMAFGRLVGDKLLDRYGYRNILVMDSICISGGLVLAILAMHPYIVIVGFALVGFGVATIIPIVYTLAGKNPNIPPGVALAAVSSIGFTGFLIGPPIIGFLAHLIGLRLAFLLPLLLGTCIALLSRYVNTGVKKD